MPLFLASLGGRIFLWGVLQTQVLSEMVRVPGITGSEFWLSRVRIDLNFSLRISTSSLMELCNVSCDFSGVISTASFFCIIMKFHDRQIQISLFEGSCDNVDVVTVLW